MIIPVWELRKTKLEDQGGQDLTMNGRSKDRPTDKDLFSQLCAVCLILVFLSELVALRVQVVKYLKFKSTHEFETRREAKEKFS